MYFLKPYKDHRLISNKLLSLCEKKIINLKPNGLAKMNLSSYIITVLERLPDLELKRIQQLEPLSLYIFNKISQGEAAALNFICTHNSRRSHLGQIWLQMAAAYYDIALVVAYSGGTEETAFNPRAVAALQRAGFAVEAGTGENPRYKISSSLGNLHLVSFSKKYDHVENPKKEFCAVMTCSEADEACPVIFGANLRIKLLYEDPKSADGTDHEHTAYDERCFQIATEMFYVMKQVLTGLQRIK
jgi:arsenate reductase